VLVLNWSKESRRRLREQHNWQGRMPHLELSMSYSVPLYQQMLLPGGKANLL